MTTGRQFPSGRCNADKCCLRIRGHRCCKKKEVSRKSFTRLFTGARDVNRVVRQRSDLKLESEGIFFLLRLADVLRSNKQREYSHICVQNKVASGVADGEVVSGQLALL